MKVALVHNPSAGDGDLATGELRRLIERHGHEVAEFGKEKHEVRAAVDSAPDVLALAGGDGTVSRAITVSFAEQSTAPIAIFPAGTSNNIARSLGLDLPIEDLIGTLSSARHMRLDVGRITGPAGEELFVESAGVGFIGTMIRNPPSRATKAISKVRGALTGHSVDDRKARGVARLIRKHPLRAAIVSADGKDLSGDYLALEAMNIREVGPNIRLAPDADPSDGLLDLALVRIADRNALADSVEQRATGSTAPSHAVVRAKRIELSWDSRYGHVDDDGWPKGDLASVVTITIAGAVTVRR